MVGDMHKHHCRNGAKMRRNGTCRVLGAVDNSTSRVAQRYPHPLHSATPHSSTALPPTVAQCNPIIYRSAKDHPGDHHPPPPAAESVLGSFELGVVWLMDVERVE